jgi:hypothetical protein
MDADSKTQFAGSITITRILLRQKHPPSQSLRRADVGGQASGETLSLDPSPASGRGGDVRREIDPLAGGGDEGGGGVDGAVAASPHFYLVHPFQKNFASGVLNQ